MPKTTRPLTGLRLTRRISVAALLLLAVASGMGFCQAVTL